MILNTCHLANVITAPLMLQNAQFHQLLTSIQLHEHNAWLATMCAAGAAFRNQRCGLGALCGKQHHIASNVSLGNFWPLVVKMSFCSR